MCVILDDDEVSSDEDEPLQKQLRQLSGAGPAVLDEAAADKRTAEEATSKRVAEERAAEEVTVKAAATEEVAGKTANEDAGAIVGLAGPRPGALSGRAQEGYGSKWLHPASQTSLQWCLETSVCPAFSPPCLLFLWGFILLLPFLPRSPPSGAATATGTAAADAAVGATPGPAPDGEPRTLE
jgi:hypothetical protein